MCRYINEMQAVRGYGWMAEEEYLNIIYPGGIVLRGMCLLLWINWPPDHPGGVALIKRKNKRLGCEPMTTH